jgi:DNA repair ATPase RecN|nr:MAG TPA: hypothetical protein [Caudoviricetes sp.]
MKEIKFAGKLECNFNTQLKRHMDNVGSKLNDLVDAIKLARKDGYNIKVDISHLEKEALVNIETNKTKEYLVRIRVDKTELDEAIKKLKKLNKLAKKYEQPKPIFNINGGLSESSVLKIFKVIEEEMKEKEKMN